MNTPGDAKFVYHTRIFQVSTRDVPGIKDFSTVHHPGAVAIVAEDGEYVYLTRQYRPAIGHYVVELPAGTREAGENPKVTAERELGEEIGKKPGSLVEIYRFFSSPGYTDEEVILYYANKLTDVERHQDEGEDIEIIKIPFTGPSIRQAAFVATTAKTLIGLQFLSRLLSL